MAFGITLLIFIPGLLLGMVLDNERVSVLQSQSKIQELDIKSLHLNYLYISNLKNTTASCVPLQATLEKSIKDLSKSLDKIEEYKKGAKIDNGDFNLLSRRYLLDNLDYWVLSKKTKELCNLNTVNILYFFNSDCDICPNQGIVLTYFKKKLGDNLLVFPMNTDLIDEEPMISVLINTYKITEFPAIVIEEDVHLGILGLDDMKIVLCEKYGYNETECSLMI